MLKKGRPTALQYSLEKEFLDYLKLDLKPQEDSGPRSTYIISVQKGEAQALLQKPWFKNVVEQLNSEAGGVTVIVDEISKKVGVN